MAVQLITAAALKNNTFIDKNVDDMLLVPCIILAQELHIETLTGSTLWDDLIAEITANAVSSDYQDLLNKYLQPALYWWTMHEATWPLAYRFTNKNVMQKSSDNSQVTGSSDLQKLREYFQTVAEYYSERATKHLIANLDDFPLYTQVGTSPIETIRPYGTNFQTGMVLDNSWPVGVKLPASFLYDGPAGLPPDGYDPDGFL